MMTRIRIYPVAFLLWLVSTPLFTQTVAQRWDSLKAAQQPVIQAPFAASYFAPQA
jgi:hypothetical protein